MSKPQNSRAREGGFTGNPPTPQPGGLDTAGPEHTGGRQPTPPSQFRLFTLLRGIRVIPGLPFSFRYVPAWLAMQENPLHQPLAQPPDLFSRYHLLLANPLHILHDTGCCWSGGRVAGAGERTGHRGGQSTIRKYTDRLRKKKAHGKKINHSTFRVDTDYPDRMRW